MYNQFDDDVFLAPESTVSLHFEPASGHSDQDWDTATGEALERAERSAWARHADGFGGAASGYDEGDEERSQDLRDAIRHVLTLSWD
jgi:hypothetical protein